MTGTVERGARPAALGARVIAEIDSNAAEFDIILESIGGGTFAAA
ncbi:hypothetical protein ACFXG4_25760 [Nocardia sp. NPDC059246]